METTSDPKQNQSTKAKLYFTIAIVLLFALAMVWSVDGSFFYLIGGPIIFFFYLGLRSLPSKQSEQSYRKQDQYPNTNRAPSFLDDLRSFFTRKNTVYKPSNSQSNPSQFPKRFIFVAMVIAMFVLFFVPVAISLLNSGGDDPEVYFSNGEQYYNSQSYDSAYVNYEKAAMEDPTNEEAFIGQGNSAFEMNRFDSAIVAYEKALTINPDNADIQYKKGLIFYFQKKYDQSAQVFTSLFEKDPKYFDALLKLGDVYYDQKRYDDALKYYDQAYANGIRNNWICYVSGYLYEEKGNTKKAISLYKEALSYDSSVVDIYSRLGTLLPGSEGEFFRAKASEGSQQ